MERSVIERLAKVKSVLIIYGLRMSHNIEEIFLLMAQYCTGTERKNTHTGMPSTTATDGASLYLSFTEVVGNFVFEANIVGITSDGCGNLWVFRDALESNYTNESVFHHPSPYSPWSALHIYCQGLSRRECN